DEYNLEDVDQDCEDHAYEALKDGLMTRPRPYPAERVDVFPTLAERVGLNMETLAKKKKVYVDEHLGSYI
ncbi:MAG: hypothetical protein QMD08_08180, partial [Actinomycetota bacterium]|nr:hypothetical protein [Actinomycetota bacterium]